MTDFIGEVSIQSLIKDLYKTNSLIDDMINNKDCFADNPDVGESGCLHCQLVQHRDRLNEYQTKLKLINKDTIYHIPYIDAYAFKMALENSGSPIDKVEFEPLWQSNHDPNECEPDSMVMRIYYSRMCYDPNGYYNGYENLVWKTICIKKSKLKLAGIPYNMSPYVVSIDLSNYEIESTNCPPEDVPSFDSHTSECAVHSELPIDHDWNIEPYPDECNCNLNEDWNGYYPPDDDFWWSELDNIINMVMNYYNGIPEFEFNSDTQTWELGDIKWKVGDPPSEIWWE